MSDKRSAACSPEGAPLCALGLGADVAADMLGRVPGDLEVQAFAEHARSCSACRRATQAWELVRGAWKADVDRDQQYTRAASERRLAALWPRRTGVPWPLAVAGAATAALAAAWIASPRRLPPPAPRETPVAQVNAPFDAPTSIPTPTSIATTARSTRTLLAVRACTACGGLAAGESMGERGNVAVPRGATLSLNWGTDASLVDAASGVDVAGPAVVRANNDGGDAALMLESGTAQAHVAHGGEVETALAVTRGTNSTWVVAVQDGRTRIKVARGEVEVRTGAVREVVRAGETLDALADGRLVRPIVSVAAMTLPGSPAREALPAASSGGTRERASFALAELELAQGKADDARFLLAPLLDSADPSLAGDAAFLLLGSMPTPRERLDVLDRYLAKPRPSPYLEQAEVERARALLEAGQEADARALVRTLRADPNLPVVARAGLVRIERALQRVR
jgi:hypothetical protein